MIEEIKQIESLLSKTIPRPLLRGAVVIGVGFMAVWGIRMFIRTRLENKLTDAQVQDIQQQMELRSLEIQKLQQEVAQS